MTKAFGEGGEAAKISTHILTKRMTNRLTNKFMILLFQLTSSRRGWRSFLISSGVGSVFQLTSSRRGWPDEMRKMADDLDISTHILTKRMTTSRTMKNWKRKYFNSHPHEEDDAIYQSISLPLNISTHILTKRMTLAARLLWGLHLAFQLTSSRRGWLHILKQYSSADYFNSHPHEEDDVFPLPQTLLPCYFNSHPHEEDDTLATC